MLNNSAMKAYHEYLELHSYFARSGEGRLGGAEFEALWREFKALAGRHPNLDAEERERLAELKAQLYQDRP